MLFSSRSRFLLLASLATVAVLAFAGNAAASERSLAAALPSDVLSRALASGQITGAQYSLQRALAILAPRLADARYASAAAHADPREATMALRDLAARIGSLSSSDRRISVFIRATIVPLATPDRMRGRVTAVENVFVGASNELGAFESGVAASLLGVAPAVTLGGVLTLGVVAAFWWLFPPLRDIDRFDDVVEREVEVQGDTRSGVLD